MIQQTAKGLNSRSEADPYGDNGFLPLITAPMYSVVDESNYQIFLDNKVQVCLPRNSGKNKNNFDTSYPLFISLSLEEFRRQYVDDKKLLEGFTKKICIDTANGNMPQLHKTIKQAKEIHGDKLIIMAGNVASMEGFIELAKTGVDYIRVGIGGGSGCNTTSNTGVGQKNLYKLIKRCKQVKPDDYLLKKFENNTTVPFNYGGHTWSISNYEQALNLSKVKIVADGISSYVKQCESKYGFNDNGYAAINKLLFAGADLVMVGKLFAQCVESAGSKRLSDRNTTGYSWDDVDYQINIVDGWIKEHYYREQLQVKYSGMSTQQEQLKYKVPVKMSENSNSKSLKPSEGSVNWIPVRWSLDEWLNGSENQDTYPYLMGWINSIKSAMSYSGKTKLSQL